MAEPYLIVATREGRVGIRGNRCGAGGSPVSAPEGTPLVEFDMKLGDVVGDLWKLADRVDTRTWHDPDDAYFLDYDNRVVVYRSSVPNQFRDWTGWIVREVDDTDIVRRELCHHFREGVVDPLFPDAPQLTRQGNCLVWDSRYIGETREDSEGPCRLVDVFETRGLPVYEFGSTLLERLHGHEPESMNVFVNCMSDDAARLVIESGFQATEVASRCARKLTIVEDGACIAYLTACELDIATYLRQHCFVSLHAMFRSLGDRWKSVNSEVNPRLGVELRCRQFRLSDLVKNESAQSLSRDGAYREALAQCHDLIARLRIQPATTDCEGESWGPCGWSEKATADFLESTDVDAFRTGESGRPEQAERSSGGRADSQ